MATINDTEKYGWNFRSEHEQAMDRDDVEAFRSVTLILFSVIAAGAIGMALVTAFIVLTS